MKIILKLVLALLVVNIKYLSAQDIKPVIHYYDKIDLKSSTNFKLEEGVVEDKNHNKWNVNVKSKIIDINRGIVDYKIQYILLSECADQVSVGVDFIFNNWDNDNFVLVPSAVYAGNKFDRKIMTYPPYWYDKDEWRLDMPTTTTLLPSLEKYEDKGKIELTTGSASTPLMAFYSKKKQLSWMVQTLQSNEFGNYGFFIEEDKKEKKAVFSVMSPAVRSKIPTMDNFEISDDKGANLKKGDKIELCFRLYKKEALSLYDMYEQFLFSRKDLNPSDINAPVMPFSELWKTMNNLYQKERWEESIDMYCITKYNPNSNWNSIWQLGWVGGGQSTLPILIQGDSIERSRVIRNLDKIFTKTQAPSGLYYAYGNGFEFKGFGFSKPFRYNETFVRSQGDFMYMAQLHFKEMKRLNIAVPDYWYKSLKKQVDVFVNLWNRYKQIGQFLNVETGDICIGGSTSGAIVPAGLALASQTFSNPSYLSVAELLAEKYYNDYVLKGYTCGGPGEILSSPDSESAFALFESYVTLYEVSKDEKWLGYAKELLPICASWVVSYNYRFPDFSELNSLNIHSTGAVWASIANKHGAPAICTWSGVSLLKYFRATNDKYAIELLRDIAHGIPQYVSHEERPIAKMEPGGSCERVNLSDWEGKDQVGGNLFASCAWVEVAAMLTVTELPSIYVQKDKCLIYTFDNIVVEQVKKSNNKIVINVHNPTNYTAKIKIYFENSSESKSSLFNINSKQNTLDIILDKHEKRSIEL